MELRSGMSMCIHVCGYVCVCVHVQVWEGTFHNDQPVLTEGEVFAPKSPGVCMQVRVCDTHTHTHTHTEAFVLGPLRHTHTHTRKHGCFANTFMYLHLTVSCVYSSHVLFTPMSHNTDRGSFE